MSSQALFDVWTVVHHLYGAYFLSVLGLSLAETAAVAVGWEVFESTQIGIAMWQESTYSGDSLRNSAVDVLATLSGWLVAGFARA